MKRVQLGKFDTTPQEVPALPGAKKPGRVYLPNLRSAEKHALLVQSEVMELVRTGRIVEWHYPEGQLPVVLPLGVAEKERLDEDPKLRPAFDARYANLSIRCEKFNCAKLRGILQCLGKGGGCGSSDLKSGCHALLLHPEMAQYCGICWKGKVCVWKVAAFGLAHIPRIFSELVDPMFHPLRARAGVHVTAYLDDRLGRPMDRTTVKWEALVQHTLTATCGWFLAPPKLSSVQVQFSSWRRFR